MSEMNLYCMGGSGINIGSKFVKYGDDNIPGFAKLNTFFVDASKSNINKNIPNENIYLVDGLDGSGKKRDSNYEPLLECSKEILHKFKPADVNVVIHSAGGGTGSTIGPIIVSELLSRNEVVIVIAIGSTGCKKEVDNTIKTLKSYEMISHKRGMPINLHYQENNIDNTRGVVDKDIQLAILLLSTIFSGDNAELDSSDLKNFLNYTRVTTYSPKLSFLDFFSKEIRVGKGQSVVSLVTLVDQNTSSDTTIPVEYQAVGFLPESTKELVVVELPIHACVISGFFNSVIDNLEAKLSEHDENKNVVNEKSIIKGNEDHTEEGLLF